MRVFLFAIVGALALAASLGGLALADQVYHSENLGLELTPAGAAAGHPELRSGHVVNIHPNGPVNGALERYVVSGAKPNTSYDVLLEAFVGDCGEELALAITTATLGTNRNGAGHASVRFTAEDLLPFSGAIVSVQWTLVADGVDAYQTPCTTVTID